jgi:hypothetical protein
LTCLCCFITLFIGKRQEVARRGGLQNRGGAMRWQALRRGR